MNIIAAPARTIEFLRTINARLWGLNTAEETAGISRPGLQATLLFWSCIPIYLAYLLATQPSWMLGGGMWAEMATNYFVNASSHEWWTRFFSTDAGYIPLPQRLLALVPQVLGFPAASIAYFYTWSAAAATAMMAGAFCLAPFRALVRNDYSRFVTALLVLLVGDFEVRTFINFTYYASFLVAVVSALALVNMRRSVPLWICILPVLMLSKPAVLAAAPLVAIAALLGGRRARLILGIALVACICQVLQMAVSHAHGNFNSGESVRFHIKLLASAKYFLAHAGYYFLGRQSISSEQVFPGLGLLVLLACAALVCWRRRPANALILAGVSLLLFSSLLNAFALTDLYTVKMLALTLPPFQRYPLASYFAVLLMLLGVLENLSTGRSVPARTIGRATPIALVVWICATGWLDDATRVYHAPPPAWTGKQSSNWQAMASAVDGGGPLCVTIDPFGWIYGRGCSRIDQGARTGEVLFYRDKSLINADEPRAIAVPRLPPRANLLSLAAYVRPHGPAATTLRADALFDMKDGTRRIFQGSRDLPATGAMIMLSSSDPVSADDIRRVSLRFSTSVDLAIGHGAAGPDGPDIDAVLWFGN